MHRQLGGTLQKPMISTSLNSNIPIINHVYLIEYNYENITSETVGPHTSKCELKLQNSRYTVSNMYQYDTECYNEV